MTGPRITFMGAVPPWECDIVDHFTVAYYYQKLDHATDVVLARAGLDPTDPAAPTMVRCLTRFERELRKGDIYRIETARLDADRLAHRLIDAETGTVCTHFDQLLSAPIPETGAVPAGDDWQCTPIASAGSSARRGALARHRGGRPHGRGLRTRGPREFPRLHPAVHRRRRTSA